jgi:hypothetical protein
MVRLINIKDESERKSAYNHLAKHYKQFDVEPPKFKEYKTASDVIEGCSDIETASLLLEMIYEEKTSKLLTEVLAYINLELKIDEKVDSLVDKISDKVAEKTLSKVEKIVKDELNINTDVIIDTLSMNEKEDNKDVNVKDNSETYIKEIFNITNILKKTSV